MAFSDTSKPVVDRITQQIVKALKRLGLNPIALLDGITLWLGWTGLTWLAFLLSLLFVEVGEKSDISLAEGLLGGLLIGLAQWQVLRPYLHQAYRWIIVSALSWGALALLHIGAIGWMAPGTPNLLIRGSVGLFYGGYVGAVIGLGQWWVIRRQVKRAWRWIALSSGIWGVAIALGWLIGGGLRAVSNLFISEVIGLMLAWGAIAALSGIGIVGMMCPAVRPTACPTDQK
ncbi:MAG: hypothetical protein AAFP03_12825 [Cyanobacteria bacterium J06598_3]